MQLMTLLSCALRIWSPTWCQRPDLLQLDGAKEPSPARQPVRFELHITSGKVDAIGAGTRDAILVNGTFVGPTLRLEQGDEVEFLVRNYLREDTTMHFHGIAQRTTPWSDGVPGLTQRQIHPGASYLYRWAAEEAGTFFYHAHSKGQLMDGLYGAIVIDASPKVKRPFHLISRDASEEQAMLAAELQNQPLLLADWSQYKFDDFYHIETTANFDLACTDAIIVNGVGSQYCLGPITLDNMTNPIILKMLKDLGEDHMTTKGCVPPIQALQGDYDVDVAKLPPHAVRECIGGRNPKGNFTFSVDEKLGWAALTFVNVGGLYPLQVSIDNHELHVYAVDGQYIHPVVTDRVYVGNGNRVSVLVKLDQGPARYTIRMANDLLNQILGGFAEMAYGDAADPPRHQKPKMNYAGQPLIDPIRSFKPEEGQPYPERRPARRPDRTVKLVLRKPGRPHGAYEWSLSGHELYNMTAEELDPPMLFKGPSKAPESELVVFSEVGDWVDMILETEGPFAQSHPIHKHGNKVFFLGSGIGRFPWRSVEDAERSLPVGSFNFENPAHLDTFTTPDIAGNAPAVWTVVRYQVENPGAWLLHCHVQTHQAGGMGIVLMDGIDQFPEVPLEYREWNGFALPS
ncbi:Laccase abr2 [Colletotrichum siamense]|uniref:Laccase abr2 n=1 Tax=Colletotrichum siamense TaxID=690259 RepID=UPI0018732890|nr:Laccase abr2 [Colletotrichum siamense]KAF5516133.1 Laccase abr2 [Colletotrichum siamense]